MAILKIARVGHPVLRTSSRSIDLANVVSPDFQGLVDDMIETMREHGGVGLAAPQVHVARRVIVFEVEKNPRYPSAPSLPLTILVNPSYSQIGTEENDDWEGCLSLPDLRGKVPRWSRIRVQGWNRLGEPMQLEAEGFHARIIQHECDHLNGRIFLDRMHSLETLTHLSEFYRFWVDDPGSKKPI